MISILEDLFAYNDWAHARLFALCDGLTDEQLDQPRAMGFGSLRATLFHIYATEQMFAERAAGADWRPFPVDPQGITLSELQAQLKRTASEREALMDAERDNGWSRTVTYLDSGKNEYQMSLRNLLMQVANHGIHHKAQVLSYLKQFGRTVPAGLDYIFYKLAYPTVPQSAEAVEGLNAYGIETAKGEGEKLEWDANLIKDYFAYHDWANAKVTNAAMTLPENVLDQDLGIGPGAIRKTLLHLADVERWWLLNWSKGAAKFPASQVDTSLTDLRELWRDAASQRNQFLDRVTQATADEIVRVQAGGPVTQFRIGESLVQICMHGTHHRAQLLNMIRQVGGKPPSIDFADWC